MKVSEARDKFGREAVNDAGEKVWEPDPNKVRGMVMRYARTRDVITGPSDKPEAEYYIDDLWQWLQDKLGDGFEGIFQGDEMSPSGKFDRIGKDNLKGFTEDLYKNNDKFKEQVDDKWTVDSGRDSSDGDDSDSDFVGDGVTGDLAALSEMGHDDRVLEFFVLSEEQGPGLRGKKEAPSVGMYKHYMIEYAIQVNGIPAKGSEPSAEAFVEEWVDWLGEHVYNTTGCIVQDDSSKYNDMFETPTYSEVVEWAKDLWKKNDRFKKELKRKWGQPYGSGGVDASNAGSLKPIQRPSRDKEKKRQGQVTLGDYS